MTFASRQDAGKKLGRFLVESGFRTDIVLGLPRGGVVVAAEVAKALERALDVLVVRKIGHPEFREFAVGALAEGGVVVLDNQVLERSHVKRETLMEVIEEETKRLQEYQAKFEQRQRPDLSNQSVVLVDDGLATGATTEAAARSARKQGARQVIVAVPVASETGLARLAKVCDQVQALVVDPHFQAVGQYYWSFPQTNDDEVLAILSGDS